MPRTDKAPSDDLAAKRAKQVGQWHSDGGQSYHRAHVEVGSVLADGRTGITWHINIDRHPDTDDDEVYIELQTMDYAPNGKATDENAEIRVRRGALPGLARAITDIVAQLERHEQHMLSQGKPQLVKAQ